jgi:peptide/nickel transport system substrate-binding protein
MRFAKAKIVIWLLLILGCGRNEGQSQVDSGAVQDGGTLVVGVRVDADALNELVSTSALSNDIIELLFLRLTEYDEELNIAPKLAESWEFSPDHQTLTYHLRRDVFWTDGVPTTAHDVAFTYRLMTTPIIAYPGISDFDFVDRVEAVDDSTVVFVFKRSYADQLGDTRMVVLPRHILEGVEPERMKFASFNRQPVGNGPFELQSWSSQDRIVLVANEDYYQGRPHLDRIIFRVIPDETTRLVEMDTGGIDMLETVPPKDRARLARDPRLRVWKYPGRDYVYVGWNLCNPLFQDVRVRQALTMATNRQGIIDGLRFGLGQLCIGPIVPTSWAYNSDIQPYPFDPQRARDLLAEAGWRDSDGDGLLDRDGRPFTFTMKIISDNRISEEISTVMQEELKHLGMRLTIQAVEWNVFLKQTQVKDFDACILAWRAGFVINPTPVWHSKSISGKYNHVSYANPEVDELIESGRLAFDRQEARKIWHRFQQIIAREQPYTFLYVSQDCHAIDRRFRGVHMDIRGPYQNLHQWWVPREERKY